MLPRAPRSTPVVRKSPQRPIEISHFNAVLVRNIAAELNVFQPEGVGPSCNPLQTGRPEDMYVEQQILSVLTDVR